MGQYTSASDRPRGLAGNPSGRIDEWAGLLLENPIKARQVVKRLIKGRVRFVPTAEGIRYEGEGAFGRLLSG